MSRIAELLNDKTFRFNIGDRVFWWSDDASRRYFGTIIGRRRGYSPRGGPREFIYYEVKTEQSGGAWESYPNGTELNLDQDQVTTSKPVTGQ